MDNLIKLEKYTFISVVSQIKIKNHIEKKTKKPINR
jgi:hypothetical protein